MVKGVIALCFALLLQPGELGDKDPLDPGVFGIKIAFPADWELVPDECHQFRRVYKPSNLEGTDSKGKKLFGRLILSRRHEGRQPMDGTDWQRVLDGVMESFRPAYPAKVEEKGEKQLKLEEREARRWTLDLEEGGGIKREAVTTTFFHEGYEWRLDLIASPEATARLLPVFEKMEGGIRFAPPAWTWIWIATGVVLAIGLGWIFYPRKREED